MTHLHSVYDNDTHFKIDPETRQIKNESGKVILMQNDHNSERLTFEIPRHIDGHDMSTCNKVEVHYINLKADKTEKSANVYPVEDLQISPASEDVVICSWLISQNATKYAGSLNFVLRYACLTGNTIDYQWYTDIHKGISVSESISNTKTVAIDYSDILEKWRLEVLAKEGPSDEQIAKAVSNYMTEEVNLVKTVNGVQPDEDGDVKVETSGFSIINNASGEVISVSNSSDSELQGLRVFGKTTQNGTPTPDTPVALESVGGDGSVDVTVCGKNIIDVFNENMSVMRDGKTSATPNTVNADGSLTLNANGSMSYGQGFTKSLVAGQTVTISYIADSFGNGTGLRFRVYDINDYQTDKVTHGSSTLGKHTYTFTAPTDSVYMFGWYVAGSNSTPAGAKIHDLQLELGSIATEYEPYKDCGSVIISTPNGLPGIPVTSGGNYTDDNGQQWICDEVDFEKGVYIQRIKTVILDGTSGGVETSSGYKRYYYNVKTDYSKDYRYNVWSSHFTRTVNPGHGTIYITTDGYISLFLSESMKDYDTNTFKIWLSANPVTVQYILAEEKTTTLSTEQLAAYAELHTNYPDTSIYNDSGAWMEVGFISQDTKPVFDWLKGEISNSNQQLRKAAPRNLLDNSDFTNPVNQRGKTAYGSPEYSIDRWKIADNNTSDVVIVHDGYVTISAASGMGWVSQNFEENTLKPGKKYTIAIWLLGSDKPLVGVSTIPQTGSNVDVTMDTSFQVRLTSNSFEFLLWAGSKDIVHVGLYEGDYTIDTIPEYQPKGYGAELLECMRYFYRFNYSVNGIYSPCLAGATQIPGFLFPVTMRKVPTMIIDVLKTWTTDGITDVTGTVSSHRCTVGGLQYIELTTAATKNGLVNLTADFVADLG